MIIGISGKLQSGKNTTASIINNLTNNAFEEKAFAKKLKMIVSILTGIPVDDLEKQEVKNQRLGKEWNNQYRHSITGENLAGVIDTYTVRKLLQRVGTEAMREQIHEDVWVNALFADYKKPAQIAIEQTGGYTNHPNPTNFPNWIITDTRFPNEAKAIKDRGGIVIRVNRELTSGIYANHKPVNGEQVWIKVFSNWTKGTYIGLDESGKHLGKHLVREGVEGGGHLYSSDKVLPISANPNDQHPSETALDDYQFDHVIPNNGTIEELVDRVKQILIKEQIL